MFCRLIILLFISYSVCSQTNFDLYTKSINCFNTGDYVCSKQGFKEILGSSKVSNSSIFENAQFYVFLSSLKLYHNDTEQLFFDFINQFPNSNKKDEARFYISQYFFEAKKYQKVVNILSEINLYQTVDRDKAFFYLGYSAFFVKKYDLAKSCFFELINIESAFIEDALYYNSTILLDEGNLDAALIGFNRLKQSDNYFDKVPYYISSILFNQQNYNQLVSYLEPILDKSYHKYNKLVSLCANSFYKLNDYDKTIAYFEEYKQLNDTLTIFELYQIGVSYYNKGLYGFAINHLNKIVFNNDSIAQYAFYYLGDSYINTNNRHEAMNAFYSCSVIDYDADIQHDAYYRFVLLAYEQDSPLYDPEMYLLDFINKYPNSIYVDEIYHCISNIYLNTSNYEKAISVLEKSDFNDKTLQEKYQKITFHRGVQLYNDGDFSQALIYFKKSIRYKNDINLFYKSSYWIAESFYNLNMFKKSLEFYSNVNSTHDFFLQAAYAQAYSYWMLEDYSNAIKQFKIVIKQNDNSQFIHDAYVRLGDCYFKLMNYYSASEFYSLAISHSGHQSDYAAYKKSTSLVLLNDYHSAIESFNYLINNFDTSNYLDNAIYDLGNVYILSKNYDFALNTYDIIIEEFRHSEFYSLAHLKVGLVHYMQNKDEKSIELFKKIIVEFPNSSVSEQALNMIKNIYSENGELKLFVDYLSNIKHDYTKLELDSSMYYSAELQFMQNNFTKAIKGFREYLSQYNKGLFCIESNYYLAKSYQYIGELDSAVRVLSYVVENQENKFTVDAVLEMARMSFELGNFISSEKYFGQLCKLALTVNVKQEAIMGLVESKYQLYKHNDVIKYLSDSLPKDFFSGKQYNRLKYLQASSLFMLNRYSESLNEYKWIINNSEGSLKAESIYHVAFIHYINEQYHDCQKFVFQIIKEFPNYKLWVDKSLILLVKNYIAQDDVFQAEHVLEKILLNCEDPVILQDATNIKNTYFQSSLINLND